MNAELDGLHNIKYLDWLTFQTPIESQGDLLEERTKVQARASPHLEGVSWSIRAMSTGPMNIIRYIEKDTFPTAETFLCYI